MKKCISHVIRQDVLLFVVIHWMNDRGRAGRFSLNKAPSDMWCPQDVGFHNEIESFTFQLIMRYPDSKRKYSARLWKVASVGLTF